jgi:hypothetical protein
MPFPRPDNMIEIVAETWMAIDQVISGKSTIRRETIGYFLSALTDIISERHPSNRTPKYLNIRGIIGEFYKPPTSTSAYIEEEIVFEWYSIGSFRLGVLRISSC